MPNFGWGELMKTAPGGQASEMFERYRRLSDEELEHLLEDFDNLLEPAQSCLLAELRTRGQTEAAIAEISDAGRKHKLPLTSIGGFDPDLTREIGGVRRFHGIGRIFYGKSNYTYNELFAFEEFDTTLWWILFFIPIIPQGSFRIRRKRQRTDVPGAFSSQAFVVVRQVPFLWAANALRIILGILYLVLLLLPILKGL